MSIYIWIDIDKEIWIIYDMASRLRFAPNYVIRIHSIKMCNTADIMIITIY